MLTLETMETLREVWKDGSDRAERRVIREAARAPREDAPGPDEKRFDEWLERLGYDGDGGRWCCPVSDGFSAGWRAGYADGVQAAVRLLRVAYEPLDQANAVSQLEQSLWDGAEAHDGTSDAPVPAPVPFNRARRR